MEDIRSSLPSIMDSVRALANAGDIAPLATVRASGRRPTAISRSCGARAADASSALAVSPGSTDACDRSVESANDAVSEACEALASEEASLSGGAVVGPVSAPKDKKFAHPKVAVKVSSTSVVPGISESMRGGALAGKLCISRSF